MLNVRRLALLLILLVGVGLVLVVVGTVAVRVDDRDLIVTAAIRVTSAGLNPTPIEPYAALDPAVIAALERPAGRAPFAVLPGVQPIGAYILVETPRAALPSLTPSQTPTASITPTFTVTPTGTLTPSPLPSATSTPSNTPTSSKTATPTRTFTPLPTLTSAPTATPRPLSSPFPTTIPLIDPGIAALNGLHMTPAASIIGTNCAPSNYPVRGLLTQNFNTLHSGIDITADTGTSVTVTHSGQVIFAGWSKLGYGYLVIVQNEHYSTYYGHNSSFNVRQWQYVHKGDTIAFSGSTGNSNGPHVHYETRIDTQAVDPLTFEKRALHSC